MNNIIELNQNELAFIYGGKNKNKKKAPKNKKKTNSNVTPGVSNSSYGTLFNVGANIVCFGAELTAIGVGGFLIWGDALLGGSWMNTVNYMGKTLVIAGMYAAGYHTKTLIGC